MEGGKYDKDALENVFTLEFNIAKAWVHFASESANALFKSFFAADGRAQLAGEKLEEGGGVVHLEVSKGGSTVHGGVPQNR